MSFHISFEHLFFKSRREEWAVRLWRDVKYKPPHKEKGLPQYPVKGQTAPTVSGIGGVVREEREG